MVQRIPEFLDVAVLLVSSVVISLLHTADLERASAQVIGFLAIELALVCVFAMRGLGLDDVRALIQGSSTALRAVACFFVIGGILCQVTHLFLLELSHQWLFLCLIVLPVHFDITRDAQCTGPAPT